MCVCLSLSVLSVCERVRVCVFLRERERVYPRNVLLDAECQADGPAVGTGATGFTIKKRKCCPSSSAGHIRS